MCVRVCVDVYHRLAYIEFVNVNVQTVNVDELHPTVHCM